MKPVTSSKCQTPAKVMTFYLAERSDYSLAKTVRAIVEAIPMNAGEVKLIVSASNLKAIEQFTLTSSHLRGQFFNTIKTAYLEGVLLKSYHVQLIVHSLKNVA